jgi:hypothetical protein
MCTAFLSYRVFRTDTLNTLPPDIYVRWWDAKYSRYKFIKQIRKYLLTTPDIQKCRLGKNIRPQYTLKESRTSYGVGRDSSVVIVTRYGLDGPGIESRWVVILSVHFQTGPGAHPASYTMSTESFPGAKRHGHDPDHIPHLAPRLKKEYINTFTPPLGLRGLFYGWPLPLFLPATILESFRSIPFLTRKQYVRHKIQAHNI